MMIARAQVFAPGSRPVEDLDASEVIDFARSHHQDLAMLIIESPLDATDLAELVQDALVGKHAGAKLEEIPLDSWREVLQRLRYLGG
jgi:hypothetical protein